jgi:hypothetical protein
MRNQEVPPGPRVPNKTIMISHDLMAEEEVELLSVLEMSNDVFTWKTSGPTGVSKSIIEHKLHINPSVKPRK